MRLLILASAALALAACGQSPMKTEERAEAVADAAAVDNAVAAQGAGTGAEGAPAGSDTRGGQGTAAPDATGEPGITLPTTPPSDGGPVEPTT